ncbi:MAG: SDR family oxidoreductase [Planctomycetota bacterium]|nr:MAG: SDR family oxidoreductase [Planctomycetota bacterium]
MKRVLVTGARGFLGRWTLAPLQERGFEVHAVGRSTEAPPEPPRLPPGIRWHRTDLLLPGRARALVERVRPTHLLHLAWVTEHGRFWSAPENLAWVSASLELLEAFAEAGGKRVVVAGSCAEYDWGTGACVEKETPLRPSTLYGAAKHALHVLQEAWARERGLSQAWGRVFFPYGPGEPEGKFVASVARSLLRGEEACCTRGEQVRDLIFVADAALALVRLLDSELQGPVNIASGEARPLREVALALGRQLGRPDAVRLGALPDRPGDPPCVAADVRRLRDELGFGPTHDLEQGLAASIEFWRTMARGDAP